MSSLRKHGVAQQRNDHHLDVGELGNSVQVPRDLQRKLARRRQNQRGQWRFGLIIRCSCCRCRVSSVLHFRIAIIRLRMRLLLLLRLSFGFGFRELGRAALGANRRNRQDAVQNRQTERERLAGTLVGAARM